MSPQVRGATLGLLCLIAALAFAAPAQANRALIKEKALNTSPGPPPVPPPEAQLEGICGIAISPTTGDLYVSDYYHHAVDVFTSGGGYKSQISVNPLDGVCQLAFDPSANLYANEWHESVMQLKPTTMVFDEAESTGVAVDSTGKVYANDRMGIAVYEPGGGAAIQEIGIGSLIDAYGLAVFAGRVYVPDAATKTVKVFEPAVSLSTPQATIAPPGGFSSLVDASVTVDQTNGHVLVLDNLQPGYEHPKAAVDEFSAAGEFFGQLKRNVIDGEPSGMVVDAAGNLFVTSGNSEEANVFEFGPYTESGPEGVEGATPETPASSSEVGSTGAVADAVVASSAAPAPITSSAAKGVPRRRACRNRRRNAHSHARRRQCGPLSITGAARALPLIRR